VYPIILFAGTEVGAKGQLLIEEIKNYSRIINNIEDTI
jgi:hypothetical protein